MQLFIFHKLTRQAIQATAHCLVGCALGEIVGMVVTTAVGLGPRLSVVISIVLAFIFGYSLAMRSLLKAGLSLRPAARVAVASDSVSIATMELMDNAFILAVPGAISAGLTTILFWTSLVSSLIVAFIVTVPINRWLISRGLGHALVHEYHHPHDPS